MTDTLTPIIQLTGTGSSHFVNRVHYPRGLVAVLLAGITALALVAADAPPALALDRRSDETVSIAAGQVVDDDLAATGKLVRIDGTVRGDLYAFAQNVTVTGIVEGDVIAVAQEVVIDGQVLGDVRAAGATVHVNGSVGRNVTGAAQLLRLGNGGRIGGSLIGAGETVSVSGDVGGSLAGVAESMILQGRVGRGAEVGVGKLTLGPNARIGGNLDYHAETEGNIPAAQVAGNVRFHQTDDRPERVEREEMNRFAGAAGNFFSLTWLAGSAVLGLLLLHSFPRFVARFLDALERGPVASFTVGLIAMVATIPFAILLGITIVGLPAAVVLTGGYVAGLYGGWLLLASALGTILVGLLRRGRGETRHLGWAFLLGLLVLHVGTRIPFVGPLVTFVALALGFGALITAAYRTWKRAEMTASSPPVEPGIA